MEALLQEILRKLDRRTEQHKFNEVLDRLDEIESLLLEDKRTDDAQMRKLSQFLTASELVQTYPNLFRNTDKVYRLVRERRIPFIAQGKGRYLFDPKDIQKYLQQNKQKYLQQNKIINL